MILYYMSYLYFKFVNLNVRKYLFVISMKYLSIHPFSSSGLQLSSVPQSAI